MKEDNKGAHESRDVGSGRHRREMKQLNLFLPMELHAIFRELAKRAAAGEPMAELIMVGSRVMELRGWRRRLARMIGVI
jgi:hypothetical protein